MKPQREGGGNNIYGKDIPPFLAKLSDKEKEGYILMDLIRPEIQDNSIVRDGKVEDFKVISELGIYGIYLRYEWKSGIIFFIKINNNLKQCIFVNISYI